MVDLNLNYTSLIIEDCKKNGLLRNQAAYVLATAYWESGRTMKPVVEAFWLSEDWRRKNLRYYPWYGRGFVQLTWEANYIKAAKILGIPMDKNPALALEPYAASQILVIGSRDGWFTGKKLSDYITIQKSDFLNARRIINGTDKAFEISTLAKEYDELLKSNGYDTHIVVDVPSVPEVIVPEVPKKNFVQIIIEIIMKIFGGKNV